jgi:hypothetical protein
MNMKPAALQIAEREHKEALQRLARARERLVEAQAGIEASELIERNCKQRLGYVRESFGLDTDGNELARQ